MFQGCDPFELPSAGVGSMIDIKMENLIAFPPQSGRWQDGTLDLKLHSLIYISELQTQADVKLPLEDRYRRKQQHQKLGWYFTVFKA